MIYRSESFAGVTLLRAAFLLLVSVSPFKVVAERDPPSSPTGTFIPPSDNSSGAVAHLPITTPIPVPSVQKSEIIVGLTNRKAFATNSFTIGTWLTFWTGQDYSGSYATYYAPTPPRGCYELPTPFRGSVRSIRIQWNARDGNANHAVCGRITYRYKSGCMGSGMYWDIPGGVTDPTKYDYEDVWYGSFNESAKAVLSVECGPATSAPPESCNPCQYVTCPTNSKCYDSNCDPVCYCDDGYVVSNGRCVPILSPSPLKLSPPTFKPPNMPSPSPKSLTPPKLQTSPPIPPPRSPTTFPSPPKLQNPPPKSLSSPTIPPTSPNAPRPPFPSNLPPIPPPISPNSSNSSSPPPILPPTSPNSSNPSSPPPIPPPSSPNSSNSSSPPLINPPSPRNTSSSPPNPPTSLPPSGGTKVPPSTPPPPPTCNPCASKKCPNNSKCYNESCVGLCYCNEGYIVVDKKCALPPPSPPSPPPRPPRPPPAPKPPSPPCNPCQFATCPANSLCRNENCDAWCICETGFFYKDGKCVRPFPYPPPGGNPGPPSSCSPCTSTTCPTNSQCSTVGCKSVCTCNNGYILTSNGTCVLPPRTPTPPMGEDFGCLEAHNGARRAVGIPSLRWNTTLFKFAQTWANSIRDSECSFDVSPYPYGENIYMTGESEEPTCKAAVGVWVSEKEFYNHATNSCVDGEACEQYTQIVWKDTTDVGCAKATCADNSAYIWVCEYNPPGNYEGQKPY